MRDVGIVIVTHNSAADIGPCLDAALTSGAEVVVIDNASSDETVSQIRQRGVAVIANTRESWFRRRCKSRSSGSDLQLRAFT